MLLVHNLEIIIEDRTYWFFCWFYGEIHEFTVRSTCSVRFSGKDNPLITQTMLGLAKAYSDNDEGSKSIELYQQVLVLMERLKGREDESLVIPLTHLGHALLEEERVEEADRVLRRSVN